MSIINKLKIWNGFMKQIWGFCPKCNSDAPKIYDCSICSDLPKLHPPNYFVKQERWKKFKEFIND